MKNVCLLWLCLCMTGLLTAQSITGTVLDEQQKPVELATATLKKLDSTDDVRVAYTDEKGVFKFDGLGSNTFAVEVSFLGYLKFSDTIAVSGATEKGLGNIVLMPDATVLKEVAVTAKVPFIERKVDRTVVNVDALIANAGSTALEALERAPGVTVSSDDAIRLKGRGGVVVFIDDKPTYLSGTELANYLRSIPASQIKSIEIMTNPPAKYEAAGNSGVINIVTKRNRMPGFTGNVALGLTQGRYTRSNNSLNLNLNREKFSLFGSFSGGVYNSFQDLNINRFYKNEDLTPKSSFSQNSFIEKHPRSGSGKIGLDLYLTPRTTLGFAVKGVTSPATDYTDNLASVISNTQDTLQTVIADNEESRTFQNGTFNVNLRHNIDTLGSTITADADYVRYRSDADQTFKNYIYDAEGNLTYSDLIGGNLPSDISIYAAKVDYTKPFASGAKFEAGVKSAYTSTDNAAEYENTVGGVTTPDYNLSNHFLYNEWIHAAYANYTRTFGKFDLQGGLRAETTLLKGEQLGNVLQAGSSFERNYTNLFPTFYAAWHPDSLGKHTWTFSYGRRIDRPFFQDLNPFISPLDKFTFYGGNPNLLPTFAHNLSLSHSFMGMVNTSLNYAKTLDGINETLEIIDLIYYSRPNNVANSDALSLSVEAGIPIQKWYDLMGYLEGGYLRYYGPLYGQQLDASGYYGYATVTNSFKMPKGWNAEIRGEYQTNTIYSQLLIKSYGTLNFGVSKKIASGKGTLKLAVNDILYTRRADGIIYNLYLTDADWNSDLDTRNVNLSFSYRFGKAGKEKPKYNGSGSESEQRRVKS